MKKFDMDFDWFLTDACNLKCQYCYPQIKKAKNTPLPHNYTSDQIVAAFDKTNKVCHINMSGGEPFLFPEFINLCEGITKKHYISINTNLTQPIEHFSRVIEPNRVELINAAIHVTERERLGFQLDDFARDVVILQDQGFNVVVHYVLFPPLLKRLETDSKFMHEHGVEKFVAKVFKGRYAGKEYPDSYTPFERELIESSCGPYKFSHPYMEGNRDYRGKLCDAGRKTFKVNVRGDVTRCSSINEQYGNLYHGTIHVDENPRPCTCKRVDSIYWCERSLHV